MKERDCANCKHHTEDGCSKWDCEFEARDLISRADAIEAVEGLTKYMEKLVDGAEKFPEAHTKNYKHDMEQQIVGVAHASQVILELPSADAVSREEYEDIIKDYRKQYENMNNEIADLEAKLSAEAEWIPCSERLPKENEHVDNVCKYYLIQDEYGDMHVAHLSGRGWETIESIKALGCDVIAWMPLPKPYKGGDDE